MTDEINEHIANAHKSSRSIAAPPFRMGDGETVSIQASMYHYCIPKTPEGPYTHFEVWNWPEAETPDEFKPYAHPEDPAAYVPLDVVLAYVERHSAPAAIAKAKGEAQ